MHAFSAHSIDPDQNPAGETPAAPPHLPAMTRCLMPSLTTASHGRFPAIRHRSPVRVTHTTHLSFTRAPNLGGFGQRGHARTRPDPPESRSLGEINIKYVIPHSMTLLLRICGPGFEGPGNRELPSPASLAEAAKQAPDAAQDDAPGFLRPGRGCSCRRARGDTPVTSSCDRRVSIARSSVGGASSC